MTARKILVGAFGVVLMSISIITFARTLIQYEIKTDKGCKVIDFHDTSKADTKKWAKASWTGGCKSGYAIGAGTLTTESLEGTKNIYRGTLVKGVLEGEVSSEMIKTNGVKGSGRASYVNGLENGYGEGGVTDANGNTISYAGQLKDGLPHGPGKIIKPKEIIIGEFSEGKPVGIVTVTSADGATSYVGETKDFKPHGSGKLVTPKLTMAGQFSNGKPVGAISISLPNNEWSFEGKFNENSKPDGRAAFTFKNGAKLTANFDNGRADPKARIDYPDGSFYEGAVSNFKPDGQGRMTDKAGNWYEGSFRNGKADGDGVVSNPKGRFEVTFVDGKPIPRSGSSSSTGTSNASDQSEGSGWRVLGELLEAFATGYSAGSQYIQRNQPVEPTPNPIGRTPGIYVSERSSGMNKICYYNDAGSPVAITMRITDICPR